MSSRVFVDELRSRRVRVALLATSAVVLMGVALVAWSGSSAVASEECRSKIEPLTAGRSVAGIPRAEAFVSCETVTRTPVPGGASALTKEDASAQAKAGSTIDNQYEVYGDCDIKAGAQSCVPPVQVVVSPACDGSLESFMQASRDGLAPAFDPVRIRGARGASMDEGRKLMLAVGRSTVLIFAETPALAKQAAAELRSGPMTAPHVRNPDQLLPAEASAATISRDAGCSA